MMRRPSHTESQRNGRSEAVDPDASDCVGNQKNFAELPFNLGKPPGEPRALPHASRAVRAGRARTRGLRVGNSALVALPPVFEFELRRVSRWVTRIPRRSVVILTALHAAEIERTPTRSMFESARVYAVTASCTRRGCHAPAGHRCKMETGWSSSAQTRNAPPSLVWVPIWRWP